MARKIADGKNVKLVMTKIFLLIVGLPTAYRTFNKTFPTPKIKLVMAKILRIFTADRYSDLPRKSISESGKTKQVKIIGMEKNITYLITTWSSFSIPLLSLTPYIPENIGKLDDMNMFDTMKIGVAMPNAQPNKPAASIDENEERIIGAV